MRSKPKSTKSRIKIRKRGKDISDTFGCTSSFHIVISSVINYRTDPRKHGNMESIYQTEAIQVAAFAIGR